MGFTGKRGRGKQLTDACSGRGGRGCRWPPLPLPTATAHKPRDPHWIYRPHWPHWLQWWGVSGDLTSFTVWWKVWQIPPSGCGIVCNIDEKKKLWLYITLQVVEFLIHSFTSLEPFSVLPNVMSAVEEEKKVVIPSVQTFGKKKNATAVAHVKQGKGLIKVNGCPITLVEPEILRHKVYEPLLLVGLDKFAGLDIRIKVTGGGHVSQVYAIRQAIAKGLIAYTAKYVDEASKNELKKVFAAYDRTLLIADARRMEPKKFGGRGARARFQKSYR